MSEQVAPEGHPLPHPFEGEGAQRLMQQAFELWITPEVTRRQALGELPTPFDIRAAQRLQWPNGRIEVRLNDEVRGVGLVRANRAVDKGDTVYLSDLEGLESFDLPEEELDAGHWTLLFTGERWFVGFNFLSNRARCADLLKKAGDFVATAREARAAGRAAVAVDTLFSACELVAKAQLVASHIIELDSTSHKNIANQLNRWRSMGNVEGAFVDIFNRLGQLRPRYRYDAVVSDASPVSDEDLELVEAMIDAGHHRVRHKAVLPPADPAEVAVNLGDLP